MGKFERIFGRKALETDIFRGSISKPYSKKTHIAAERLAERRLPMKTVADALGILRSNLAERAKISPSRVCYTSKRTMPIFGLSLADLSMLGRPFCELSNRQTEI